MCSSQVIEGYILTQGPDNGFPGLETLDAFARRTAVARVFGDWSRIERRAVYYSTDTA